MKVITWNINGKSSKSIPETNVDFIVDSLQAKNPDLIILTEYVPTLNLINKLDDDYQICTNSEIVGNGVLIGVKKDKFEVDDKVIEFSKDVEASPNFLCVSLMIEGKKILTVAGCRVRIGGFDLNADYRDRKQQILSLLDTIKNIDGPIILAGDFNNGWFTEQDISTADASSLYVGKPRYYYNYVLLKNLMDKQGLSVNTPEGCSWKQFRIDHLFSRGVQVKENIYSWDFKKEATYQQKGNYPDHAMLISKLEENNHDRKII